ncbi:MAG: FRG domain-containing protein [Methyloglobulus sp.]|nr:FRG domain-containing protein [Methyloglobulus sp.]
MNLMTLDRVETLHKIFRCYRSHKGVGYLFRGQANSDWQLLPKAGRKEFYLPDNRDLYRFHDWESQAIAYGHRSANILEGLAIAQHHGLATRLLDWSQNPLVASYFAVSSCKDVDGTIYILEALDLYANHDLTIEQIKNNTGVYCYIPRAVSPRVLNQKGMFTVHCPANKEIDLVKSRFSDTEQNLTKIIIPHALKNEILNVLDDYGIDDSTLFPDLDGLSRYKNWETNGMVNKKT